MLNIHTYMLNIHTYMLNIHTYMHTQLMRGIHMYVCIYVCMHVCMYVCMLSMYVCMLGHLEVPPLTNLKKLNYRSNTERFS